MPTDNPKISAYVPQLIFDKFKQFQEERELSMSQTVIVILSEYFGIQECLKGVDRGVEVGGVTLSEFTKLSVMVHELSGRMELLEESCLDSVPESLPKSSSHKQLSLPSEPPREPSQDLQVPPVSGYSLSNLRFGLNKNTAAVKKRALSPEEFTKWTKENDPDGIPWKPLEKPSKGYVPAGDLPSESKSRLLQWIKENIPA